MRDKTDRAVLQVLILKMMMRTWTIELAGWMPYVNMKGPVPRSEGVRKADSSVRLSCIPYLRVPSDCRYQL